MRFRCVQELDSWGRRSCNPPPLRSACPTGHIVPLSHPFCAALLCCENSLNSILSLSTCPAWGSCHPSGKTMWGTERGHQGYLSLQLKLQHRLQKSPQAPGCLSDRILSPGTAAAPQRRGCAAFTSQQLEISRFGLMQSETLGCEPAR